MEQDILPDLLATIEKEFEQRTFDSVKLKKSLQSLKDKRATYIDVNEFAIEVGEILADVFKLNISAEVLPDGRMYFNIADRLLNATLSKNHELISNFAVDVQTEMNHEAGYRIKGQAPGINQDKVDGLINKISDAEEFEKVEWLLQEPIVNFSQSIVDEIIKSNVEFHAKVGMKPKLRRSVDGSKACKWCKSLAGVYDYPDVPNDVYRRHARCKCTVEYNPKDGRGIQDSHSKVWTDPDKGAKIEMRKEINLNPVTFEEVSFFMAADMQEDSDKWYNDLTEQERDSIYNYTFGEFEKMNTFLRGRSYDSRTNAEVEENIENFSKSLSKYKLEHDISTYRGVSKKEYKNILEGNHFKDFKSTSTIKEKAKIFAHEEEEEFIVKFNIPKGNHGAFVGANSVFKKESEFTINKNAKYATRITPDGLEVTIDG